MRESKLVTREALATLVSNALSYATEQDDTYGYSDEPGSKYVTLITDAIFDGLPSDDTAHLYVVDGRTHCRCIAPSDDTAGGLAGDCWEWQGPRTPAGYGVLVEGVYHPMAHQMSYEAFIGPVPEGLCIDHLCANKLCVSPFHLEAVTQQVNILRGTGPTAVNARKTHCPHGHEYSPENTMSGPDRKRYCRICGRNRNREWRAARREMGA